MSSISTEEPDWEGVIPILYAFTKGVLKGKTWFRGKDPGVFLQGKQIDDYVYDAIGRYLEHPEKFKPEKGSLIDYLKFNLIKTLVGNDLRSQENQTTNDIFNDTGSENEVDNYNYLDTILPYVEAYFDQQVDYDNVMSEIASIVEGENEVEQIFVSIYGYEMKPREIMNEFGMSKETYNNAFRRLKTIIKNVVKKFDLTEHKI